MEGARARELVERAPIGIYRTTRGGRFLYANAAYVRMLGYSSLEEVLALDLATQVYFDPAARSRVLAEYARHGELHGYEVRLKRKDGSPVWVRFDMARPAGQGTDSEEMEGFVTDISGSKRAEEDLRKLSRAVEHSPASVVITDTKGTIEYVNPAFTRVTGYAREEVIGQNPRILKSGESPPETYAALWDAITHGREWHGEFHNRRKDGTLYWEFASISPIVDADGCTTHFIAVKEDMTSRKEAEAALGKSELYYRSLIEHALDLTAVLAPDGTLLFVSGSSERLLGIRPEDARGRNAFDLIHGEDVAHVKERIAGVLSRGSLFEHVEFRVRHADGTWRTLSAIGKPMPPETGIQGLIINARDISERLELEAQLMQSQKMEAVGRLAGGVAHDFNNLLTAILGYTELLLQDVGPDDPKSAELNEILAAAQRAAALTRQLLTFSRKQVVQVETVDVAVAIRGMEQMLRRVIGEDVDFTVSLPGNLWHIRADRSQIEQLLLNLVVNARDAMPKGGRLRIEASDVSRNADRLPGDLPNVRSLIVLSIADSGVGMEPETLAPHVRALLHHEAEGQGHRPRSRDRVRRSSTSPAGSRKSRARSARARRSACSSRGEEGAAPQDRAASGSRRRPLATGSETILLVEDEDLVRKLAARRPARPRIHGASAASGPEALALAAANAAAIRLVVPEVVMPGMSGPQMAAELAARGHRFPVLYMSGYAESDPARPARRGAAPGQAVLPDTLVRRVRAFLDGTAPRADA